MIYIKNTQKTVPIDQVFLKDQLKTILTILKYDHFTVSLLITTDATMRKYNKRFRNIDKATDILSFPYHPNLKAGSRIKAQTEEEKNLGDLILAAPYILKQTQTEGIRFEQHVQKLLVHGICHLLGYDHIEDKDWRRMRAKEAFILKNLRI